MSTFIEELSLNAWPSLQTVLYDGWIIRFANGYTKRANSVNPLYPSTIGIDEKIRFCENIYEGKKMSVVFKITPAIYPSDLDERLSAKVYQKDSPTSVQVMDLTSTEIQLPHEVSLQEALSNEWLDSFCHLNSVTELHKQTLEKLLKNIVPPHCFVSLKSNDRIIACGLGVLQSDHVGLFDIVTDDAFRGCGCGRQIVKTILAWGKQNMAKQAYLQVMLNNAPALRLYSKAGFTEKYQYWYRIKP